jgi:hypothetical protein
MKPQGAMQTQQSPKLRQAQHSVCTLSGKEYYSLNTVTVLTGEYYSLNTVTVLTELCGYSYQSRIPQSVGRLLTAWGDPVRFLARGTVNLLSIPRG